MNQIYKLYGGDVKLHFDEVKHVYTVDGKVVEGVTGVTGVINKPALMYWAVNMAIGFLEKAIKPGVGYDELQLKSILEGAKGAHRKKSTEATDIGTLVHEAIETYIKEGKKVALINTKAKDAFNQFLNWAGSHKIKFIESERKIYSKEHGYAGTMDFHAEIDGKSFIGDIKTSSGIYDEYWFQTSAYQQAYVEETGLRIDGQIIVRVGKDGSLEVKENYDYEKNIIAFNGALALYKRLQELKDKEKQDKLI